MTHVLLIRHGETDWNVGKRIQGHSDIPLNEKGRRQAAALSERLKNRAIDAIYSSDLSRAVDTITPTANALSLEIQTRVGLREKSFGEWEGLNVVEIEERYPELWDQYHIKRDLHTSIPGGETWEQVQARVLGCLKEVLAAHGDDETVIMVGHGGSLRPIIMDALDAPLTSLKHISTDNTGITHLEYRPPHGGRVHTLNDISHIEGLK